MFPLPIRHAAAIGGRYAVILIKRRLDPPVRSCGAAGVIRCADTPARRAAVRGTFGRGEPEAKRSYQATPAAGMTESRMLFMLPRR
ncbi:hypothetical protein [Burkholderia stabilis]|uniref:hypothetical protein n=1 Tax=Burkholderia stabilis TaxID=95485 RepID=UPI001428A727|nr:hypothetical protein [Burkholderia stabilis]HDR9495849.1 hypothetical protein [Burkholderia stabilis]HDR9542480.1 hypothetical protein [Burkholderia stabilis]HDR9629055.1 hypothetical protein [Burkholderia stabilis]HDR9637013.1 hypothetical protein [Burkholderia stabilis]